MVIMEKPNNKGIRIGLDPHKKTNRALKHEHYRSKTLHEVTAKLATAKYLSHFDCQSGFWMIKLGNESFVLTAFNTPFGRYKFHRLPFSLHTSQADASQYGLGAVLLQEGRSVAYASRSLPRGSYNWHTR